MKARAKVNLDQGRVGARFDKRDFSANEERIVESPLLDHD
jgi:hypothetical protein